MTTPSQLHIAVWGVGAMGSLFGGYLSAVARVTMIGSWRDQLDAVQRHGLTLYHMDGQVSRFFPEMTPTPDLMPAIDLALVLVKSHQTARIAPDIARVLSPNGVVMTLQNGVGNLETLAQAVGTDRATQGVTAQGATMIGPGEVRHAGAGATHIALTPTRIDLIQQGAQLLNQAGIETTTTDSADRLIWGKLAVNVGLNPLTALLDVRNGELLEEPRRMHAMVAAAREVEAVAAALGISLPYPDVAAHVIEVARVTGANLSSMLQDMRRGVPTEIDAICGAVVQRGTQLNIPTPINATLLALIRERENGRCPTPEAVYRRLSAAAPNSQP